MAISSKRYVDITSGVGGSASVSARELILRLFTPDDRLPQDVVLEATEADDVATYFGIDSPEYARAVFYLGFINKQSGKPRKISFARFAETAAAPRIIGVSAVRTLSQLQAVTAGAFKLTLGERTEDIDGLDFSEISTISQAAAAIQTAIRAITAGGPLWTAATVEYNAPNRRFELTGGDVGALDVGTDIPDAGTDIRSLIGWGTGAIFSPGVTTQDPVDALIASNAISDNFGSFVFLPAISVEQAEAVAAQNDTYNVKYLFLHPMQAADASALYTALSGYSGVACVLSPVEGEFPELLPAALLASTNYNRPNAVQNYMFYQAAGLTASVEDDTTANTMDGYRVNYYGVTQRSGRLIAFFQRGVMMGLATDPVDMNVYANEMWLKDSVDAKMLGLLLSAGRIPANENGRATILSVLQESIEKAVTNGAINVGKTFDEAQKAYITDMTNDPTAWVQVQNLGYWKDCVMESYVTTDSRTEWKAVYLLIYAKDDAIRKVEGTHSLI